MPHKRIRHLESMISANLKWSPAVGLFGLRQVGKTTLVQNIQAQMGGQYETFDREAVLEASRETPIEFCRRRGLLCLDEAQKGPWIFPAIKDLIGTHRKPGQFLLTGSIRFTLKKEIREALTGRIILHELLPFSVAEARALPASSFLQTGFDVATTLNSQQEKPQPANFEALTKQKNRIPSTQIHHHLSRGGLPIPCFSRDSTKRTAWWEGYFETLLTRDVVLVDSALSRVSYRQGISFLRQLALMQGQEKQLSELAAKSSLNMGLARRLFDALEALSLIDLIPPEVHAKKSTRKLKVEWKDIGLWNHLAGVPPHVLHRDHTAISLALSQEFRSQLSLMAKPVQWSFYKSRDGATIPWIFRLGKAALAINYISVETPRADDYRQLKKFLLKEPQGIGLVLGTEQAPIVPLGERLWLMPYTMVF